MEITIDQVIRLSEIQQRDEIDITRCESMDDFTLAFLAKRDTETLEDIVNGLVDGLSDSLLRLAAVELNNRQ